MQVPISTCIGGISQATGPMEAEGICDLAIGECSDVPFNGKIVF